MNKPVMEKLYQELTSTFSSEDDINLLSVQKLDYMFAVLHETLRIYPAVVAAIPRRAPPEGSTIGGRYIPPNVSRPFSIYGYANANSALSDYPGNLAMAVVPQPKVLQGPRVFCSGAISWRPKV